jgi:hypothetical protein
MADPTLVLLVVLGGAPGEPAMNGPTVGDAIRASLGASTRVLVEDHRALFTDQEMAVTAERTRADAVATVAWSAPKAANAHVRIFIASNRVFYDRDLAFGEGDAMAERERSVGFVVGAMVQTAASEPPPPEAPPPLPPPAPPEIVPAPERPTPPPPRARMFSIDAALLGAAGIGGAALGAGPRLGGGWRFDPRFVVRIGGSVAFGSIDDAAASTVAYRMTGSLGWRALSLPWSALEVGLGAVVVNHRVSRDTPEATRDRWTSGGQLSLRFEIRGADRISPFVSLAGELVGGKTPIVVHEHTAAEIPLLRVLAEAGATFAF